MSAHEEAAKRLRRDYDERPFFPTVFVSAPDLALVLEEYERRGEALREIRAVLQNVKACLGDECNWNAVVNAGDPETEWRSVGQDVEAMIAKLGGEGE